MPQKAKYTEEDYLAIKKDLEGASDSNEANEVFVAHAEEHKANYTALKNGYVRKAKWKREQGDKSWLELYDKLFPGKINILEQGLNKFSKKQIIEWILEYSIYETTSSQRTFIKASLEGGANDNFLEGILATYIMNDMNDLDDKWLKHRHRIHTPIRFWSMLILSLTMIFEIMVITQSPTILMTVSLAVAGVIPLGMYINSVIHMFKKFELEEEALITETNTRVMDKYPPELLQLVYKKYAIQSGMDDKEAEEHYSHEIDFGNIGLITYLHEITWEEDEPIDGWGLFKIPYENDYVWYYTYKMLGITLTDCLTIDSLRKYLIYKETQKQNS